MNLAEQLKASGPDKIIFMVETDLETQSSLLGLDGKPLYHDPTYNVQANKRNWGVVLQMPDSFTPDIPVWQEGRYGRTIKQRELPIEISVGDKIYFDWSAIGNGRQLAPGIYFISYKEIIASETIVWRELSEEEIQQDEYINSKKMLPGSARKAEDKFIPIATHVLLKPVFKETVQEIDPTNQPGVMGEINASGLVTSTDQHLRGAGEIGAYKLVHHEKPDIIYDDEPFLPEKLLTNDLYIRNQATVAHIGSNIRHRAPVAQVGDRVLCNLIDNRGMPNVPTITIAGEEYYYLRQHEIEGVFYE